MVWVNPWTTTKINQLKELNEQDITQAKMAEIMGVTVNAISGMRGRLIAAGEMERKRPPPKSPRAKRAKTEVKIRYRLRPRYYKVIKPVKVSFPDLTDLHCLSVMDEKDGVWPVYCGLPRWDHAWCEGHAALYYGRR